MTLLALIGLSFLGCAFWPGLLENADAWFDFRRLAAAAIGLLFLYLGFVTRQTGRLRERLLDLMEEVLKTFYGPNFRREREAIDILVRSLSSDNATVRRTSQEHLVRLTGVDLGADAAAWASWWTDNRSTFRAVQAGARKP